MSELLNSSNSAQDLPISDMDAATDQSIAAAGTSDFVGGYNITSNVKTNKRFSFAAIANFVLSKFKPSALSGIGDGSATGAITALNSKLYDNAGAHNAIFRGKYLGGSVTAAQWSAISNGTFDDLYIGDYWTIDGVNWRIAAFDYWLRCGNAECTTHHAVIVPDSNLLNADGSTTHYMNDENTTLGGYYHSKMRGGTYNTDTFTGDGTTVAYTLTKIPSLMVSVKVGTATTTAYTTSGTTLTFTSAPANGASIEVKYISVAYLVDGALAACKTKIDGAFGSSHILTHKQHLSKAVTNGYVSAGDWYDSSIDLMNESMVYGGRFFENELNGSNIPAAYTIDKGQLPLFALAPQYITNRAHWWLRSVVSASYFAHVDRNGGAGFSGASATWVGVRPAFAIK